MERDFKGIWIPKNIWLNKSLTIMEKLFLIEIDSLDNEDSCYASNKHFSGFFDISKGRCTQIIKSLEEKKYIEIKLIREGKQVVKRLIRVVNILNNPIKNTKQPYLENDEDINTSLINTNKSNTTNKVIVPIGLSIDLTNKLNEFVDLRKKMKKPIKTDRPISAMVNQIGKTFVNEDHLIQCLDFAMDNEYQGVRAEYVKYDNKKEFRTPEEKAYHTLLKWKESGDDISSEELESKRIAMVESLK